MHTSEKLYIFFGWKKRVAAAIYNDDAIKCYFHETNQGCNLIQRPAKIIRDRVKGPHECEIDSTTRDPDHTSFLVLIFSGPDGPIYAPKSKTAGPIRCSMEVYFDADFAGLILAYAIICK